MYRSPSAVEIIHAHPLQSEDCSADWRGTLATVEDTNYEYRWLFVEAITWNYRVQV